MVPAQGESGTKDLIYKGYKVVPYDPRIGATLSSHELAQGYKEVEDPSIIRCSFKVADANEQTSFPRLDDDTMDVAIKPGMLAVGDPDIDYSWLPTSEGRDADRCRSIASKQSSAILNVHRSRRRVKGSELGRHCATEQLVRLHQCRCRGCNAFQVFSAEFVSTEERNGHCALLHRHTALTTSRLARQHDLPVVHGVGLDGQFKGEVEPVKGLFFKDADKPLIRLLKERGHDVPQLSAILHSYPFGWRTGDPILYYAKNAWYIRTSKFRRAHGQSSTRRSTGCPGTY